jgi:hypothetical protein
MKILVLSVVTIVIISVINQSCIPYNHIEGREYTRDTMISLMENIISNEKKILIIFENSDMVVQTSLSIFKEKTPNWVENKYKERQLFDEISKLSEIQDSINVLNLAKILKIEYEYDSHLAELLEQGYCMITMKKTSKKISYIRLQFYNFYCGGLCGEVGRRFFIDDIKFFSILDGIA